MTTNFTHPSPAFLRTIDLHQLLPQQEPFVMVHRIVSFSSASIVTETDVRPDCLFLDHGRLTTEGMIENVAQTCAVRIGYIGKYITHQPLAVGVVGAVSKLQVSAFPSVGSVLTTTATVEQEVFGIILVTASIECGGNTILTTSMKLGLQQPQASQSSSR